MKKRICLAICLLFSLLLWGCASGLQTGSVTPPPATTMPVPQTAPPNSAGVVSSAEKVEDYFPVLQNVRFTYEGIGNEYATYISQLEFAAGNKLQTRVDNGGTIISKVYKWENGKVIRVLTTEEAYVRENLLNAPEKESEILLQEPLAVGTVWEAKGGQRSITGVNVPVSTLSGTYQALEVTTKGMEATTMDYYVKGVGLVKSVFQPGENEISSSLAEVKTDTPYLQVVRLYYPSLDGTRRFYREVQLSMPTNMVLSEVMEAAYKVPPGKQAGSVFPADAKILSLQKNNQGILQLDMNKSLAVNANPNPAYEKAVLSCIADTFGELFLTDKVLLTIEGQPYQSAHVTFAQGEAISVEQVKADIIINQV